MEKNISISTLLNLGNTCYINACLQILCKIDKLNELLDEEGKTKLLQTNKNVKVLLLNEWNELRKLMQKTTGLISPNRFLKTLQYVAKETKTEIFTGHEQNDINELFIYLINLFHEALKREVNVSIKGEIKNKKDKIALKCYQEIINEYKNGYSEINQIFNGMSISIISDYKTKKEINYKCETYLTLELPIAEKNNVNLKDCFNLYTEEEILTGENGWYNEETNEKVDIMKKILFWSLPQILVITLKRFVKVGMKNHKYVDFPTEELDLSEYVIGYNKEKYKYKLLGINNHYGRVPQGGHYTTIVKDNKKWVEYDDDKIKIINKENIVTNRAYVLYYEMKTDVKSNNK